MTRMEKFKASINCKDVEGNRTYLYTTFEGCKYGQSYPNTTNTKEGMINDFIVFYYPFVEERKNKKAVKYMEPVKIKLVDSVASYCKLIKTYKVEVDGIGLDVTKWWEGDSLFSTQESDFEVEDKDKFLGLTEQQQEKLYSFVEELV